MVSATKQRLFTPDLLERSVNIPAIRFSIDQLMLG